MTFAKEARSGASTSGSLFCLPAVCGADEGIAPVQKPRSSAGRRDKIRSTAKYTEHTMTMGELSDLFGTHINEHDPHLSRGLSASLANNLLLTNGNNTISPPIITPRWMLFMLQFTETFMVLLQFAAFLSLLSYFLQEAPKDPLDLYIGIFLIVVVIFQCASTYWQETKSDELMEKFRALAPQYSLCIREGVQLRLPSTDLVVGDIIRLPMGVKVPADCRLIYISSGSMFRVDQSSITGESEPVDCNCKISSENNAFEAFNLTFSGSLVVEGEALAVIIRSGDHTLLGDMVKLSSGLGREASMLKQDVGEFVWVLSKIAVFMGLMVFLAGIYRGLPVLDTLIDGFIVTIIANLPCGLPATVTACLLIVAERMRSQNVFVKKLDSVETLGACSLICTDKTGTLTQNIMSVSHAWVLEENCNSVLLNQPPLMSAEHFVEACCKTTDQPDDNQTKESTVYRARTNGMSDFSAATMLLKLAILNSRVGYTSSSDGGSTPKASPSNISSSAKRGFNNTGGIDASGSILLSDFSTRDIESALSEVRATQSLTGDATEIGIYKFCDEVNTLCHYFTTGNKSLDSKQIKIFSSAQLRKLEESVKATSRPRNNAHTASLIENVRQIYGKLHEVPFNSVNKWQMSLHDTGLAFQNINLKSKSSEMNLSPKVLGPPPNMMSELDGVESSQRSPVPQHSLRNTSLNVNANPLNSSPASETSPSNTDSATPVPFPEIMCVKGAPDVLLSKCSHYIITIKGNKGHKMLPIDKAFIESVTAAFEQMAAQGERALAYAMKWLPISSAVEVEQDSEYIQKLKDSLVGGSKLTAEKGLCFVGLLSLIDPPRPEVPKAIATCASSGIQVVMVTGDYPTTAQAIARKIGLMTFPTKSEIAMQRGVNESEVNESEVRAVTIHGAALDSLSDSDWKQLVRKDQIVFARTTPEQKLTIVKHFMNAGHIVAMTGDGVNDSPALKQASIGISMGLTGSDVAREAADIVLLDDNFASIVVAIREGRLLFDNLKKSVAYTVSHLLPEVVPVIVHFCFGLPLGLPAVLALCIDLLTEMFPATSLAYELEESDIMNRPPRDVHQDKLVGLPLLSYAYLVAGLFEAIGCLYVYFEVFNFYGFSPSFIIQHGAHYFREDSEDILIYTNANPFTPITYTAEQQNHILHRVQSAYFLTIIISQAFHIFQIRARTTAVWERGFTGNGRVLFGIFISLLIGFSVVYIHIPRYAVFETEFPPASSFIEGVAITTVLIYSYNELRKNWGRSKHLERIAVLDAQSASNSPGLFVDNTNRSRSANVAQNTKNPSLLEKMIMW